jgi:hypothetical protein
LLKEQQPEDPALTTDIGLRLAFCAFLAACTYTTLARAEDMKETHVSPGSPSLLEELLTSQFQYYLEVRRHCQEFRRVVAEEADQLSGPAQDDMLSKQLQVVKLELEAALKLQRWDDLEELFEQCWNCRDPDRYETLADLVLVIHSEIVQADVAKTYQSSECIKQPKHSPN